MVNWSSLLLNVGIDVPSEREQFNISCPFHVDQLPSCSINVEVGKWICFAGCGQGSLVTFLAKYTGKETTPVVVEWFLNGFLTGGFLPVP